MTPLAAYILVKNDVLLSTDPNGGRSASARAPRLGEVPPPAGPGLGGRIRRLLGAGRRLVAREPGFAAFAGGQYTDGVVPPLTAYPYSAR